jgi:hypothetical protein
LGGRDRQISEFEASLVYIVSSRTIKATQRNHGSENQKRKKKEKRKYVSFIQQSILYNSAIKNKLGKLMEPDKIFLSEATQIQKENYRIYFLICRY